MGSYMGLCVIGEHVKAINLDVYLPTVWTSSFETC